MLQERLKNPNIHQIVSNSGEQSRSVTIRRQQLSLKFRQARFAKKKSLKYKCAADGL